MQSESIVKAFDVLNEIRFGFGQAFVFLMMYPSIFQSAPEVLHHGSILTNGHTAHADLGLTDSQQVANLVAVILTAPI